VQRESKRFVKGGMFKRGEIRRISSYLKGDADIAKCVVLAGSVGKGACSGMRAGEKKANK